MQARIADLAWVPLSAITHSMTLPDPHEDAHEVAEPRYVGDGPSTLDCLPGAISEVGNATMIYVHHSTRIGIMCRFSVFAVCFCAETGAVPSSVLSGPPCGVNDQPCNHKYDLDGGSGSFVQVTRNTSASTGSNHVQGGEQDGLEAWCCWMGMSGSARSEWEKIHVNPLVAMRLYSIAGLREVLTRGYITSGLRFDTSLICYLVTIPHIISLKISAIVYLAVWRTGSDFVNGIVFKVMVLIGLPL